MRPEEYLRSSMCSCKCIVLIILPQETGDSLMALTYIISSTCNGIIALQVLYYWNTSPEQLKNKRKKIE